jgi:hypothetical protein
LTAELEAHLGIAEKTLAEFIVDVAKSARNVDGFKQVKHMQSVNLLAVTCVGLQHVAMLPADAACIAQQSTLCLCRNSKRLAVSCQMHWLRGYGISYKL